MPAVDMRQVFFVMEEVYNDIIDIGLETAASFTPSAGSFDGTFLEQMFNPGKVQQREFGQQVALQKMQNEWNSEGEKMKRLIAAGVNPLTAAQGVSQSGQSGSTGLVPSIPQSGTLPEAVESVGNVVDKLSSANERDRLLDVRRKNIVQDTFLKLSQAGYQSELAKNLALATSFLPAEKTLTLLNLGMQAQKLSVEYSQILQDIEESKKRVDELDSLIELNKAQGNYAEQLRLESEKRAIVLDYQGKAEKWRTERMISLNCDPNNPLENEIFMQAIEGNQGNLSKGLSVVRDVSYNNALGMYDADEETAYKRAYNFSRGTYSGDPFQQQYRDLYDGIVYLQNDREDFKNMVAEAKAKYERGEITAEQYSDFRNKVAGYIQSIDNDIDRFQKEFSKGSYKMGHSSMSQDILKSAVSIGIGVGAYSIGKRSPVHVKGFNR